MTAVAPVITTRAPRAWARLRDLASVTPLLALYALAIGGVLPQILEKGRLLGASPSPALGLAMASQIAAVAFLGLQIVLFAIRRLPEGRAAGALPRLAALLGWCFPLLLFLLPARQTSPAVTALSTVLTLGGTAASIYVVSSLGRSFAVTPQARGLVTGGPYRLVRHPLYLAEQIATFGVMLHFAQPWSLLIALAAFAAQWPRMHYEEQILAQSYPAYRTYMRATARLFPGVY